MFLNPDPLTPGSRNSLRAWLPTTLACVVAALLGACSTRPASPVTDDPASRATPPLSAAQRSSSPNPPAANPAAVPASDAVARLLAQADRVRLMAAAELTLEAARLGEAPGPESQIQLALVLGQLRQLPESMRAQELLARVLGNADPEAQPLHPLARLLAARFAEQRRLEELLDRQTQQTREVQRRLDQTSERLEALKAIERSLTPRAPAAAAPAPAPLPNSSSRSRNPAP